MRGESPFGGACDPAWCGPVARVFKHRVEYGEEHELVPSNLFYLSGWRPALCLLHRGKQFAFDPRRGVELTTDFFRQAVADGRRQGAQTLQWVGGEPTIHLPTILEVMAECPDLPRVVWKSDFYGTLEAFALLDEVVQVYLADFKFGNNAWALRLAGVERYLEVVTRNLLVAACCYDLIVRHLLLPGHYDCCFVPVAHRYAGQLAGREVQPARLLPVAGGGSTSWSLPRPLAKAAAAAAYRRWRQMAGA